MEAQGMAPAAPVILKPGVFSSYGNGWKQLWPHFLELFLIGLIAVVINFAIIPPFIALFFTGTEFNVWNVMIVSIFFDLVFFIYSVFITNPLGYGVSFAFMKAARGDKVEIRDMFRTFKNYWNAVGASLLMVIIISIGFMLLIIPGFFLLCKLAFVPYLVTEKKMSVMKGIGESWRMTKGHGWKVFLIGLMFGAAMLIAWLVVVLFPVAISPLVDPIWGFVFFGIISILGVMWLAMTVGSLYYAVDKQKESEQVLVTPPAQQGTQTGTV
jgi:uncharacterized membrane protein